MLAADTLATLADWDARKTPPSPGPIGRRMRIPRLDKSQVDAPTGEIFDQLERERGKVPNMFRTVAHRPEILRTLVAHWRAVLRTGTVPLKLKELVIVRTSQINRCDY